MADFAERDGGTGARELALAAGRAVPHAADASLFVADPRNAQSEEGAPSFLHAEWADDSVYQRAQRLAALTGQTRPVRALRVLLHRFWQGLSRTILHKDCEVFDEPPVHRRCWEARRCICCPESASLVKLKANLEKTTRRLYRPGALRSKVDSGFIVCCFIGLTVRHDEDGGPAAECDDDALYAFMHVGFHSWNPFEPFYVPMRTPEFFVDMDGDQKLRERWVVLEALPRSLDVWAACEIFDLSKRWLLAHFELIENDFVVAWAPWSPDCRRGQHGLLMKCMPRGTRSPSLSLLWWFSHRHTSRSASISACTVSVWGPGEDGIVLREYWVVSGLIGASGRVRMPLGGA